MFNDNAVIEAEKSLTGKRRTLSLPYIQLIHFTWTGVISGATDILILYFLVEYLNLSVILSTAISFITATIANYFLNIKYVFISGRYNRSLEFLLFFSLGTFGLISNIFLTWFFYSVLLIWYILARLMAISINVVINFIVKKYYIFIK